MRLDEQRLNAIQKQQKDLRRRLVALGKQALVIQGRWLDVEQQSPAALGATAGGDMELFAEFAQQIRQAAALEVLDALDCHWTEDDLKVRRLFKLPVNVISGTPVSKKPQVQPISQKPWSRSLNERHTACIRNRPPAACGVCNRATRISSFNSIRWSCVMHTMV
jgi:hypothetical protein